MNLSMSALKSYSLDNYIQYLASTSASKPNFQLPDSQFLMKSLIHFSFGGQLQLSNVTVSECFLYEPEFSTKRGMVLFA
jgi:hypothetical protein